MHLSVFNVQDINMWRMPKEEFRIIGANKQLEISSKSTFVLMSLSD